MRRNSGKSRAKSILNASTGAIDRRAARLKVVEGKRDQLVGKIKERYGIAREEASATVLRRALAAANTCPH
jgi:uncharacterized protein YjbJ (UPF0337 family)